MLYARYTGMEAKTFKNVILGTRGIIYDTHGNTIYNGGGSSEVDKYPYDSSIKTEHLEGEYIQLTTRHDLHVFGHLREDLGRLHWFQSPEYFNNCKVLKNHSHIIRSPDSPLSGKQALTQHLEWFGFPEDRQLEIYPHTNPASAINYRVDTLHVAPLATNKPVIQFLKKTWLKGMNLPEKKYKHRRIYLDRPHQSTTRTVLNREEIISLLESKDFHIFSGGVSFEEQSHMFRDADIIIGPHGAAFFSCIFCENNPQIIEFMPSTRYTPMYKDQVDDLGNASYRISKYQSDLQHNFYVPIQDINDILDKMY